jgi:hypothetical protein
MYMMDEQHSCTPFYKAYSSQAFLYLEKHFFIRN